MARDVSLSCDYETCGNEFTLNDLPIHCDECRKDYCFAHREPGYHECPSIQPDQPRPQPLQATPLARGKKPLVQIIDLPEPAAIGTMPIGEASPEPSFALDPYAAKIGLVLVAIAFVIITRALLF